MTFTIITLHLETLAHLRYFVVDLVQRCVGADSHRNWTILHLLFLVAKKSHLSVH